MASHNISVIDTVFPYGDGTEENETEWPIGAGQTLNVNSDTSLITSDSPSMGLFPSHTNYSVNDKFAMYMIYRPNGNNSIWVPIKQISWNWTIAAKQKATGGWEKDGIETSNCDPCDQPVYILPEWSDNAERIRNQGWVSKSKINN